MKEPFRTLYWLLMQLEQLQNCNGKYFYNVKLSNSQDAFYIGNDNEHITIMANVAGFHHTIRDEERRGQHTATTLEGIIQHIKYNGTDIYTNPAILAAIEWLLAKSKALPKG